MRDIYLIDFENVASEGLSGITYLSEDDQVIIFYSNNSNRLTMKMHILIGKSVCKLNYFEVSVGGKNALDHQISTWLGYLVGTNAAERNYFIVSRDMGYKHVAAFWANNAARPRVRCIENIRAANRLERRDGQRRNVRPEGENAPAELPAEAEASIAATAPAAEEAPLQPGAEIPVTAEEPAREETRIPTEEATRMPEEEAAAPLAEAPEPAPSQPEEPVPTVPEEAVSAVPEEPVTAVEAPEMPESAAQEQEAEIPASQETAAPQEAPAPEAAEAVLPQPEAVLPQPEAVLPQPEAVEMSAEDHRERPVVRSRRDGSRNGTRQRRAKRSEGQNAQDRRQTAPEQKKPQPEKQDKPASGEQKPQKEKQEKPAPAEQKTQKVPDQLSTLIAPYPKLKEASLRELIAGGKKQILCNTLRKQLGQEKGLALYNEIKKAAWH